MIDHKFYSFFYFFLRKLVPVYPVLVRVLWLCKHEQRARKQNICTHLAYLLIYLK